MSMNEKPTASNPIISSYSGIRIISQTTAQTRKNGSQDDPSIGITGVRILRRSSRSASVGYTASDIQEESRNYKYPPKRHQHKSHLLSCQKKGQPLSGKSIRTSKRVPRRQYNANDKTQICTQTIGNPLLSMTPSLCSRGTREYEDSSASADIIPARLLLSLAKRSVELDSDWFGRKICVMDVILDLKDLARWTREALIAHIMQHGPYEDLHPQPFHRTITIWDKDMLDTYWKRHANTLSGVWDTDDATGIMGFPESTERSTATWSALLDDINDDASV